MKITSVTYTVDYLKPTVESERVQQLKDSLKLLTKKITILDDALSAYASEKQLVLKNNDIKGTTGLSSLDLEKAADFYRLRLNQINTAVEKLNDDVALLNEQNARVTKQLAALNAKSGQAVYSLSVTASVKAPTTSTFAIHYLVYGAGWAAFYDIRALDVNSPISLDYKAKVYNNCGIDWNSVNLTLSTADPTQTAQRPSLTTWDLNYENDITTGNYEGYLNEKNMNYEQNGIRADTIKSGKESKKWDTQYTTIQVSELSVEFDITTAYTIPSDNKVYFVDIETQDLPATYKYIAIPKMDKDAFLVAKVTGWEDLNLVEGNANIFYGGTFVGQSYIDTRFAQDSLEISLGRDKKVSVTRTKKKDFSSKNFIGGNYKETLSYEINVRNNNKTAIDIELQDQVPVSQNGEIKVDVDEISGATQDPLSGKLTYKLKLAPSESKKLTITFSIQYPKTKQGHVKMEKTRALDCPSF